MSNADRLHDILDKSIWIHKNVPIPAIIEVSPTDYCNLKCSICPHSNPLYPNNKVFISQAVIDKLYADIIEMRFGGLLVFSGYGEPTFTPDLIKYVSKLSNVCMVDVVTNGTTMDELLLSKLLLSGVNKILVSAYSPNVYTRMCKLFKDVSPNKYEIRCRYTCNFAITNRGGFMNHIGNRNPCWYLTYCMVIDYNGDVMLCPQDFTRNTRFGNIMSTSLFEIWDSSEMNKRRCELLKTRRGLIPCNRCNAEGTSLGERYVELWNKYRFTTQSTTEVTL